jgi:ribosomal protein RSM22 (predicted rRNA methylase)
MVAMPLQLTAAIDEVLSDVPPERTSRLAAQLSRRYRDGYGRGPLPMTSDDVSTYIAYRLPATFAATVAVLNEARERRPDLEPRALLDAGAGPGTSAWAVTTVWPGVNRMTMLERDPNMIRAGKRLATPATSAGLRDVHWAQVDLMSEWKVAAADVVTACYVLGELPRESLPGFIANLWAHSSGLCAVVEPGTPAGFKLIRQATEHFAALGALVLAPFPPDWSCLESERDWTHFSVRVPRTRSLRLAKQADLAYEDEKYCYMIASRTAGDTFAARVIRHPQIRRGHIRLVLGTENGVRHLVVARSGGEAYRRAKSLSWGDALTFETAELLGLV